MGTMDYHKCIACQRGWVSKASAEKRVNYARLMLGRYPLVDDWKRVRFSGKAHFGYGSQTKLHIVRKPGQRFCQDCIQERDAPKEKDLKRYHCWAAVGWDFKSDIIFYDAGNGNGKMK